MQEVEDPPVEEWRRSLFGEYSRDDYERIWGMWKLASLALFAVFVVAMIDCARTLRRIAR